AFGHFLWEVYRKGSVTAWWYDYRADTWNRYKSSAWGILFVYLLDRRLLHLSFDELLQLKPILNKGYPGVIRLWRNRLPEEFQQVCRERRLVTKHLGCGVFLPYPLTEDIRVGHVILDDIRWYFWRYAANQCQKSTETRWHLGPNNWPIVAINIIEQSLTAPMFEQAEGILSRRPETEKML